MAPQTQKQLTRSWTTRRDENAGACNLFSLDGSPILAKTKIIELSKPSSSAVKDVLEGTSETG